MTDVESRVFTRVKEKIKDLCTNASTTLQSSPATFPYVYLRQIDNTGREYDLENNEAAVLAYYEVHAYTTGTGSLNINKKIFQLIDSEMLRMGFQRNYGPAPNNELIETKITERVARYSRLVCVGDIENM